MNSDDKALLRAMGRDPQGIVMLNCHAVTGSWEWRQCRAAERLCKDGLAIMQDRTTPRLTREGCALVRELRVLFGVEY